MKIKVRIDKIVDREQATKAYASINIEDAFIIKGFSVMEGKNGLFLRMPYRTFRDAEGRTKYQDMAYCIDEKIRNFLNLTVLDAYRQKIETEETLDTESCKEVFCEECQPTLKQEI